MTPIKAELNYSESFPADARAAIQQAFADEGIEAVPVENDIFYESAGTSPENVIIAIVVLQVLVPFVNGYFAAAGADAWEATKRALKKVRRAHHGGQEVTFEDENANAFANYIIPRDPTQQDAAIEAIAADFAVLDHVDERWWLGPPDSRWGTGLESAHRNEPRDGIG